MHDHGPVPDSRLTSGGPVGPQRGSAAETHGSHSMWWMVVCCAPMVLIALAILLGVFGSR
jgi:hypothetical protein